MEDETGTAAAWSITAYAICANLVTGLQRGAVASAVGLGLQPRGDGPLPGGQVGDRDGRHHQRPSVLDAVFPDAALTSANISAFEDATGNAATGA